MEGLVRRPVAAGFGLALVSAASFGTSGSFAKSLTDDGWSPVAAVAARIGLGAAVLAVPAVLALRGRWRLIGRNVGPLTLYGMLAVVGVQVCFFYAIQYISVGVALLIEYLGILMVVAWMWAVRGQRPRRYTVLGGVLSLLGLVLVLDLGGSTRVDPIGVLFGLGAAVGLGAYFVISADSDDDVPPLAFAAVGMLVGAIGLLALGWAGLLPMAATFGDVDFLGGSVSWLVPVLGLAVVAAALSYASGVGAARALGARLASFVGLTEVLFAVLFAWLLLDELPVAIQLVGGVCILVGIALVRIDELRIEVPDKRAARSELSGIDSTLYPVVSSASSPWDKDTGDDERPANDQGARSTIRGRPDGGNGRQPPGRAAAHPQRAPGSE